MGTPSEVNWTKSSFTYAWRAVTANPSLHILFLLYSIFMLLISALPLVGFLFGMVWQISLFSVGAFISRAITDSFGDLKAFEDRIRSTKFLDFLLNHADTGAGAFIGTFLLTFLFQLCVFMVGVAFFGREFIEFILSGGKEIPSGLREEMDPLLILGIVMLLTVFLVVLWVAPIAYGYTLQRETLTSAIRGVFKVFNLDFFKASLKLSYLIMYLSFTAFSFIGFGFGGLITLHPVTSPLGLALIYITFLTYFSFVTHAYLLCRPE